MKTKFNFKNLTKTLLIVALSSTTCDRLFAQETKVTNFKVVVQKTETGIKMQSINGTAWIDLSFTLNNDRPQAIDEYGMTEISKISNDKNPKLADFLFTITKTPEGILLKGLKGTYWSELNFLVNNYKPQAIDRFGMTKLN